MTGGVTCAAHHGTGSLQRGPAYRDRAAREKASARRRGVGWQALGPVLAAYYATGAPPVHALASGIYLSRRVHLRSCTSRGLSMGESPREVGVVVRHTDDEGVGPAGRVALMRLFSDLAEADAEAARLNSVRRND